ncbi:MAG TPA: hypothetical protein DCK83_03360 [Gallionellaceae bacterium]|nr:hypothetical protein [Gallionellaceae bacterium]
MNIGLGGAALFWLGILWPLVVSGIYFAARRPIVSNMPALFFACVLVGYAAMVSTGMILDVFERYISELGILIAIPVFLAPIVTTVLLVRAAAIPPKAKQ